MRWLLALAVAWCALAPARARAENALDVCEAEPAPPACEWEARPIPLSAPVSADCNDTGNPLLADLVSRCDMPELLPKAADLQSLEDEAEGPKSPPPGDLCEGPTCSQGDPPLSPRRISDLSRTWAMPPGGLRVPTPAPIPVPAWAPPPVIERERASAIDRPPRAR